MCASQGFLLLFPLGRQLLVRHTNVLTVTDLHSLIPFGTSLVRMTQRSIEDIFPLALKLNINVFNEFVTLGRIPNSLFTDSHLKHGIDLFQGLMNSCI